MSDHGDRRGPVKVVIINTQYVDADARSFKSVVQKLTGRDAVVDHSLPITDQKNVGPQLSGCRGAETTLPVNVVKKWSMGEFDRLLKEMPPLDELWD